MAELHKCSPHWVSAQRQRLRSRVRLCLLFLLTWQGRAYDAHVSDFTAAVTGSVYQYCTTYTQHDTLGSYVSSLSECEEKCRQGVQG